MPDNSKDSFETAKNKLSSFGCRLNSFNQGTFRTDIGVHTTPKGVAYRDKFGGQSLGGGYCAGVCLDWVRRALLSKPDRDAGFLTYYYTSLSSGGGAHGRSATEAKERAYQTVGRMAQAWSQRNDVHWTRPQGAQDWTLDEDEFSAMAAALDDAFDRSRKEAGRGVTGKHFSDLVIVESSRSTYPSALSWMRAALAAARPGHCLQLNFSSSSASGHAVVAWQRLRSNDSPNAFYFFDPNFGVFGYTLRGLGQALKYLFWWDANNKPRYAECALPNAQIMSYVVYGPPNLVEAISVPPPKTVAKTPPKVDTKPTTTAKAPTPIALNTPPKAVHTSPPKPTAGKAPPLKNQPGITLGKPTSTKPATVPTGIRAKIALWEQKA